MILFKSGFLHVFTLFLIVILIILWEIGEIQCEKRSKRGIMDNINNGIKFAGQMFGINNAADVANLMVKAFVPTTDNQRPIPNQRNSLNTMETENIPVYENLKQIENEPINTAPGLNTGLVIANMLKVVGLDTAKLGAIALNVIIVIAQMIGNSLMQQNTQQKFEEQRQSNQEFGSEERQSRKIKTGSPFDWILENPSPQLVKMLDQVRDEKLTDNFIDQIDEIVNPNENGDCIKMLICKSEPFVLSMQKQVINRLDGTNEEQPDNSNTTNIFYKNFPKIDDFKKQSAICEKRFPKCNFEIRMR